MNQPIKENPRNVIHTEYLMTIHAARGGSPRTVDKNLTIYFSNDGSVTGPRISGKIIPPTGDWLNLTAGGALSVDARMVVKTEDEAIIYITYGGVLKISPENFVRLAKGQVLTSDDIYFITTPKFSTAHPDYLWLNSIQAIGKLANIKGGEGGYVEYDLFGVS